MGAGYTLPSELASSMRSFKWPASRATSRDIMTSSPSRARTYICSSSRLAFFAEGASFCSAPDDAATIVLPVRVIARARAGTSSGFRGSELTFSQENGCLWKWPGSVRVRLCRSELTVSELTISLGNDAWLDNDAESREPTRSLMRLAFCAVQQLGTQSMAPTLDGSARGIFVRQQP